jgi:ABC-type oligopeptide transport system ATPase subunit
VSGNLVEVINLCKHFEMPGGRTLKAVDGVSFAIRRGETLGLVGESGCGKTTLGRCVKMLYPATSGENRYDGETLDRNAWEKLKEVIDIPRRCAVVRLAARG